MPHTGDDASSTIVRGASRRDRLLGARSRRSPGRTSLYPAFAALLARVARAPVRKADIEPTVAVIIAAYNEEAVIARRIENLLALDYPRDKLQIVVTSDASSDRTEEIAAAVPGRAR